MSSRRRSYDVHVECVVPIEVEEDEDGRILAIHSVGTPFIHDIDTDYIYWSDEAEEWLAVTADRLPLWLAAVDCIGHEWDGEAAP